MTPSQIINDLQSLLTLPHAISVDCSVDNFECRGNLRTQYTIYVASAADLPNSIHATHDNLEHAYNTARLRVQRERVALTPITYTPIPDPLPAFLSCSSPEQDGDEPVDIEPLIDTTES